MPSISDPGTAPPRSSAMTATRWAYSALGILFVMHLLNYMDRNILAAILPQIKATMKVSNEKLGQLPGCFLVTYSLIGPLMGWAADRYRRTRLLALGVGIWSIATIGSGLARNFDELWYSRALLGVGEATYGVIAPVMLMDLFSREARSRVMSAFYLAMPVGSALGFVAGGKIVKIADDVRSAWLHRWLGDGLGGWLDQFAGWQVAFFLVGVPALLSVVGCLFLPNPPRGGTEDPGLSEEALKAHQDDRPSREDYMDLMVNSSYTYMTFGQTAYTFAIGGLVYWMVNFLYSTRGIDQERANLMLGIVTVLAAIVGTIAGGWLSDWLARRTLRAPFLVSGVAMLLAVPFMILALFAKTEPMIVLGIFLAEALMFVNTGPCSAILGHVVQPNMRAVALAISILVLHFLGDVWSPWLIGLIADRFGSSEAMAGTIGQWLAAIGAVPTKPEGMPRPENMLAGMLIVIPAVALSGVVLLAGARHLPREMALMQAKLRASHRRKPEGAAIGEG